MRLSKDDDSWKASGIKRRDFRSAHDAPEVPRRSGPKRKKNTKKWCRGREGKEHTIVRFEKNKYYSVDKCSVCGKELKWYWNSLHWYKR